MVYHFTGISGDFFTTVCQTIQHAYRENQALQDPSLGHDDWTYAVVNWRSVNHLLLRRLQGSAEVAAMEENNSIQITCAGYTFRIHKLGKSEFDDPRACFPGNPGPAGRLVAEQLELGIVDPTEPSFWVIGIYGNLEQGLRAVRLQAPSSSRDDRITGWSRIETLWQAGQEAVEEDVTVWPSVPAPEPVPVPDVRLRDRERV